MQTIVLPPTASWIDACDEGAAQLGPNDELLVTHDGEDDSVAGRNSSPESVQSTPAGDPVECSGKAIAIAAGTEPPATTVLSGPTTASITPGLT